MTLIERLRDSSARHDKTTFDVGKVRAEFRTVLAASKQVK